MLIFRSEKLLRIVLPTAICGVLIEDTKVVNAAPMLARFLGHGEYALRQWVYRHGGTLEFVARGG